MTPLDPHAELCIRLNWPRVENLIAQITILLGQATMLPRVLRNQALRLLRPTESMVRRLLVLMAAKLAIPDAERHAQTSGQNSVRRTKAKAKHGTHGCRPFPLLDPLSLPVLNPLPSTDPIGPRIWSVGMDWRYLGDPSGPVEPTASLPIASLHMRLEQLQTVLGDIDKQAARMARWLSRRKLRLGQRQFPMRPGRAPGQARKHLDRITKDALRDLHHFAWIALRPRPG